MKYLDKHLKFIRENIKGTSYEDLTEMFNKEFGTSITRKALASTAKRYGYRNGNDGKFKKGHTPANKGKKGVGGWKPTQFKKGQIPANYRPVGSERVNVDGYIEIKVKDPSTWRLKHIEVWEKENKKKLPEGHAIVFIDQNKLNCKIENLQLVHRRELLILNRKNMLNKNADSNRCSINIAKLEHKICEIIKNKIKE